MKRGKGRFDDDHEDDHEEEEEEEDADGVAALRGLVLTQAWGLLFDNGHMPKMSRAVRYVGVVVRLKRGSMDLPNAVCLSSK
ncbi:hypothetical protein VYU27_000111 [Nannochloropsis oceanica]